MASDSLPGRFDVGWDAELAGWVAQGSWVGGQLGRVLITLSYVWAKGRSGSWHEQLLNSQAPALLGFTGLPPMQLSVHAHVHG